MGEKRVLSRFQQLAALLVERRNVPRHALIELAWQDDEPMELRSRSNEFDRQGHEALVPRLSPAVPQPGGERRRIARGRLFSQLAAAWFPVIAHGTAMRLGLADGRHCLRAKW